MQLARTISIAWSRPVVLPVGPTGAPVDGPAASKHAFVRSAEGLGLLWGAWLELWSEQSPDACSSEVPWSFWSPCSFWSPWSLDACSSEVPCSFWSPWSDEGLSLGDGLGKGLSLGHGLGEGLG